MSRELQAFDGCRGVMDKLSRDFNEVTGPLSTPERGAEFRNWTKAHLRSEIRNLELDFLGAELFEISGLRWAYAGKTEAMNLKRHGGYSTTMSGSSTKNSEVTTVNL